MCRKYNIRETKGLQNLIPYTKKDCFATYLNYVGKPGWHFSRCLNHRIQGGRSTEDLVKKHVTLYCLSFICLFVNSFHGALGTSFSCLNFIPGSSRLRIVFAEYSSPRTSYSHKVLSTFTRKRQEDLCKNFRTRWSTRLLRFP